MTLQREPSYPCMSSDEFALWLDGAIRYAQRAARSVSVPCADCPVAFAREMTAQGRCVGLPGDTGTPLMGRPWLLKPMKLIGQGKRYASEEERLAARRQSWRESAKRRRERAA